MQQDPQIILGHSEAPAQLGALPILEEERPQQIPIFTRKLRQDAFHLPLPLLADQRSVQIDRIVADFGLRFPVIVPRFLPDLLHEYVIAYRADESAKPLRMVHSTRPHNLDHPQQRLLPDILDQLRRADPNAQLQPQQVAEIQAEVALDSGVAAGQAFEVVRVEGVEEQWSSEKPNYTFPIVADHYFWYWL